MKKYLKYLIELIVIVVGITLSFMVDEWREERQNREKVISALKIIQQNLVQDSIQIERHIDSRENEEKGLDLLLDAKGLVDDSVKHINYKLLVRGSYFFNRKQVGYENLVDLELIEFNNIEMLNLLETYYNIDFNLTSVEYDRMMFKITDFAHNNIESLHELKEIRKVNFMGKNKDVAKKMLSELFEKQPNMSKEFNQFFTSSYVLNMTLERLMLVYQYKHHLNFFKVRNRELRKHIAEELQD